MLGRAERADEAARMVNRGGRITASRHSRRAVPVDLAISCATTSTSSGSAARESGDHSAAALMAQKRFDAN